MRWTMVIVSFLVIVFTLAYAQHTTYAEHITETYIYEEPNIIPATMEENLLDVLKDFTPSHEDNSCWDSSTMLKQLLERKGYKPKIAMGTVKDDCAWFPKVSNNAHAWIVVNEINIEATRPEIIPDEIYSECYEFAHWGVGKKPVVH